jgi:hypothetical protein
MTDDSDTKLDELLREDAPQARDPLFRLSVLERRERMRFRRRMALLFAVVVTVTIAVLVGFDTVGDRIVAPIAILLFGVVLSMAVVLRAWTLIRVVRRFWI